MSANKDWLGSAAAIVLAAAFLALRQSRLRAAIIANISRWPLLRTIFAFHRTALFCRNLDVLLGAAVPLTVALRILADMMNVSPIDPLGRAGKLATLIYLALIVALCLTSTLLLWDTMQRYQASNAALETLARFQNLRRASNSGSNTEGWPAGSPFLEGTTVTLASATLLQRITTAITQAGGNVVSSEVEPQRPKDDYVKATATCEVAQVATLQQLLHDLEAGMPFLFIDQLVVEAATSSDKGERMRVRLAVSGQWRGAK